MTIVTIDTNTSSTTATTCDYQSVLTLDSLTRAKIASRDTNVCSVRRGPPGGPFLEMQDRSHPAPAPAPHLVSRPPLRWFNPERMPRRTPYRYHMIPLLDSPDRVLQCAAVHSRSLQWMEPCPGPCRIVKPAATGIVTPVGANPPAHRAGGSPAPPAPRRTRWMPKTLNALVPAPHPVSRPRCWKI